MTSKFEARPVGRGSLEDSDSSDGYSSSEDDIVELASADRSSKRRRLSNDDNDDNGSNSFSSENNATIPKFTVPSRVKEASRIKETANAASFKPPVTIAEARASDVTKDHTSFATLDVAPWLVASLSAMAIKRPTAIQRSCIPEILKGRNCIGGSKTGSGKTVAFAVPILQLWAEDPTAIFAVILTPTRELALQIFEQVKAISAPQFLKPILITGGTEMRTQAIALSHRPHIVIATPGRLADHINTSGEDTICGLRRVRFVVLDEADRLLASGPGSMLPDVETCLSILPPSTERQTCLFTATVTPEVRALKEIPRAPGRQPVFISEVDTEVMAIPTTLQQKYLQVPVTHREAFLHGLLLTPMNVEKSTIIFCNRAATARVLEHMLRILDHRVTSLHSKLPQGERISNLARFRANAARLLVATDVASRGLDIPDVGLVINFDVPRNPDDYIHRVGRTARAGRKGDAVTMVGQRDVQLILAIEERVGRKMVEYEEKGVNIESRVVRDYLKVVGEAKREAVLEIEEGRDVRGKRVRSGMKKLQT
ncbi:MAG: putative RNA helicase [Cirrosporium novae-zelandiae]|nr:MAG: putative RNA helicase [Cirrosporium novae-zelandiae]